MDPAPTTKTWFATYWKHLVLGGVIGGLTFTTAFYFAVLWGVEAILRSTGGYEAAISLAQSSEVVEQVVGRPFTVGSMSGAVKGSSLRTVAPVEATTVSSRSAGCTCSRYSRALTRTRARAGGT